MLEQVVQHAKGRLNHDGNWEDKLMILETTLDELQALRQNTTEARGGMNPNEERLQTRRPSLMRSGTPLVTLDA